MGPALAIVTLLIAASWDARASAAAPTVIEIDIRPTDAVVLFTGRTRLYRAEVGAKLRDRCLTLALIDVHPSGERQFGGSRQADLTSAAVFNTVVDAPANTPYVRCVTLPASGRFEFTITSDDRSAHVRPILFADDDGNGALDLDAQGDPVEVVGVGGATLFIVPLNRYDGD